MKKKIFLMIYIFGAILYIFTNISYGYLDPSAMTYIIQITAALIITISTSIGIMFYKFKRMFKKKKLDKENEKKECETNNIAEYKKD